MKHAVTEAAYFVLIITIVGAASLALAVTNHGTAHAAPRFDCTPTVTLYAAGYPDADSSTAPPGVTGITSPGGIFPWEAGGYDHGQTIGAQNTIALTDQAAAECPGSQIKLHGHSFGAAYVHTALSTIDHRPYAGRVHVYLTGDPRRIGGIEDTYAGISAFGITMRGHGVIPQHVASYENVCHVVHDAICSFPKPWINPVGSLQAIGGYLTGGHIYN